MREAWLIAAPRFEAYRLLLPGSPRFVCQPQACTAYCCHAYSVSLGDADVERMKRFESLELVDFLELDEDRRPITLPLAQPYLLARSEGHCKMLGPELGCGTYDGRPNACRLYPHFVVFWDAEALRARTSASKRVDSSFQATMKRRLYGPTPLLLGHTECPGFTGDPITETEWWATFESTYQLQYATG